MLQSNGAIVVNGVAAHDVDGALSQATPVARPWRPAWVHEGIARPADEHLLDAWIGSVKDWGNATIHHAPSLALGYYQNTSSPMIYARWESDGRSPRLNSLAILGERKVEVPILPGFAPAITSRRVIESTLAGDNSPAALDALISALMRYLASTTLESIAFPDIDAQSPLRAALRQLGKHPDVVAVEPTPPAPHWWIRFPDSPESYWAQFSKKTRYNFRYRAKHLPHSIKCYTRREEVAELVERVTTLANNTWQQNRLGVKMIPERKLELWSAAASMGALRSYLLMQEDRVLSFAIGFQWKGHFIYDDTGYDPAFSANSPGQVLLYRMIEDLIARDTPHTFDFGYGDGEYKRIYANHQTMSGPMMLVKRAVRPMAILAMGRARSSVGRRSRAILAKTRILSLVRHIHRGHSA